GASSKKYANLVGTKLGWSRVPDGKRASTYEIPQYQQATAGYYKLVKEAIENADPANPGVQPRPAIGIQFVDVPEFADMATKVSSYVDDVLTGASSVQAALDKGQKDAEAVTKVYQKKYPRPAPPVAGSFSATGGGPYPHTALSAHRPYSHTVPFCPDSRWSHL